MAVGYVGSGSDETAFSIFVLKMRMEESVLLYRLAVLQSHWRGGWEKRGNARSGPGTVTSGGSESRLGSVCVHKFFGNAMFDLKSEQGSGITQA
jgi:hypothetical protein